MSDNGVNSLLLRNFNQDPLENLFGALRALGYRNINPNCSMFASSYRTLVLNNLMSSHSPGGNCEDDLGGNGLIHFQNLFNTYADEQTEHNNGVVERVADGPLKIKSNYNADLMKLESQTKNFIAGYIVKRLNATFLKNCTSCLTVICTITHSEEHELTEKRDYMLGGKYNLKYPSLSFCRLIQGIIDLIGQRLPSICHHKSLKYQLIEIINTNYDTNILSCATHGPLFGKKLTEFIIKLIVHSWCTQINRILAGKIYISSNESDQIKINASSRYKTFSKKKNKQK